MNLKLIISVFLIFGVNNIFSQETEKIKELNYAGIKILVPNNCEAKSEYELLNCNNTDIQWLYLNTEMLTTIPAQFLNQFASQSTVKKESDFKLKSFNSELTGKKIQLKSDGKITYRIIVSGIINEQPLLLNIGTENNILKNSDLNELLGKFINVE
ncbi:MAG TPA: hypothetical protein VJ780_02735 [Flavobacterium sp.]|nr:hypothetical protein [Flavobacterium sp.]